MRKHLLLILLFPIFLFAQKNFDYKNDFEKFLQESKDKKSEYYYPDLLDRYNKIDTTLTEKQILSLLISFTDNKYYKPYKDIDFGRNLYKLNDENKFEEVIKSGEIFLSNHPFDLKSLFEVSYAYHKINLEKESDNCLIKANQIFKAMFYSGNAMSIENPSFALNPSDGQDFIRKAIGVNIGTMGSGRDKDGYFIDILEAKFEDGESKMLYFIIPHATRKMFE